MNWLHILHAVLSLIFVIGLLFLCLWIFKYLEHKTAGKKIFSNFDNNRQIEILEIRRIDTRSSIVLVRCQQTRHTLLLSPAGNLLLNSEKMESAANE